MELGKFEETTGLGFVMCAGSKYQIGILGRPNGFEKTIESHLLEYMDNLGISNKMVTFLSEADVLKRNRKYPFSCLYFGYKGVGDSDHKLLQDLISDSVFILPVVEDLDSFSDCVPDCLAGINGIERGSTERIATALIENFHLLRSERRLFISYRRAESQGVAIQLYEALEASGFDVFLDTHSVAPGEEFQDMLWHRLADSDIVVLLETKGFRDSFWTTEELTKANTTSIQIFHLLWPGVDEDPTSAFSHFVQLSNSNFEDNQITSGANCKFSSSTEQEVVKGVEKLRARALAARFRDLVDSFIDKANRLKLSTSIQPERYISLELDSNKRIAVVPAVGIPHAHTYEIIQRKIDDNSNKMSGTWLLYDERGVLDSWQQHLDWLNSYLPLASVKSTGAEEKMKEAQSE